MKTNKNYMMRTIAGESFLVPVGDAAKELNGMISMNSTAAFIWENIDTSTPEELIQKVCEEFEIPDENEVRHDVQGTLLSLYENGLIFIE